MRCTSLLGLLAALLLHVSHLATAQSAPEPDPKPPVAAQPVEGPGIVLDGRRDERARSAAETASDFAQQKPGECGASSQPTDVRILYTESSLYIGVVLHYDDPSNIKSNVRRRDRA